MNEPAAVLTVEEVAALLRISRGSAYEAVRCGQIPSVRLGRIIRVPRHALAALLGDDLRDISDHGAEEANCNGAGTVP